MERKEINPKEFTWEMIEKFLGPKKILSILSHISNFGDGPIIFTGDEGDKGQGMAVFFCQEVRNNRTGKYFKKTLPTIIVKDYQWEKEIYEGIPSLKITFGLGEKIIERVEKIEMTDEIISFWGTTGRGERRLDIYQERTYLYTTPSLKLRDDVPSAIEEVKSLRGRWTVFLKKNNKYQRLIIEVGTDNHNNL